MEAYQRIGKEAEELGQKMTDRLKDAYFQLVLYPTFGACHMNEKFIYAAMSMSPKAGRYKYTGLLRRKGPVRFSEIQRLTRVYNTEIAGGKWNKMMDWKPRNQSVFRMPPVGHRLKIRKSLNPIPRWLSSMRLITRKLAKALLENVQLMKDICGRKARSKHNDAPFYQPLDMDEMPAKPRLRIMEQISAGQRSSK